MPVAVEVEASQGGFAGGADPAALTPVCPLRRGPPDGRFPHSKRYPIFIVSDRPA